MVRALVLGLAVLAGCSGGFKKVVKAPNEPLKITTVIVYPFGFRWEEPNFRSFEMSQRLIEQGIRDHGDVFEFYGPSEFKVLASAENNGWVGSTALPLLTDHGKRPQQGLVLRAWAEQRKNESIQEAADKKGKAIGGLRSQEIQYLGHVEIVHPSTSEVLIEVTGEAKSDPFAVPPPEAEWDEQWVLTRLMANLTKEALSLARKHADPNRPVRPDFGLTVALVPRTTFQYFDQNHPPHEIELAKLDPIARELFEQQRARFLAPFLSDRDLQKVTKAPKGLFVAAGNFENKIEPGDVIETIEDLPALPQRLAGLRFSEVPVQCKVQKADGRETEVQIP